MTTSGVVSSESCAVSRKLNPLLSAGVTLAAVMLQCLPSMAQDWRPERNVELIVPATAGGSLDFSARTIQRLWKELRLVPTSSVVANRAGGGHAVAYSFLSQRSGDPHYLSITSPTLLTSHITGRIPFSHGDFTPIAVFATEYIAFAVRADSPIKSGVELLKALKAKPAALTIALGNAPGSTTHIALGLPLQSAGVDMKDVKIVSFNSSTEALTALLGGHVDVAVASTVSVSQQADTGKIRPLSTSSPQRLGGAFANVPTWGELGQKGVFENWRGAIGAKGLTPAQSAFWGNVFAQLVQSDDYKSDAQKNQLEVRFRGPAEMRSFLDLQHAELKSVMTYLKIVQ